VHVTLTLTLWIVAWLLWSGLYTPLLISLGVLSSLLVLLLSHRMGFVESNLYSPRLFARLLPFWGWLAGQLVRANLDVARIVLSPRLPISPTVIRLDALSTDPVGQAILGNAITLTPGTVTIDDHDGSLFVHSLTREGALALCEGEMNRRVAALLER
jgi:multicomponent Na+:H+ antiporter subunit E